MAAQDSTLGNIFETTNQLASPLPPALVSAQDREEQAESKVLIVDGEPISRRVLKAMLRTAPYQLLEAEHPNVALDILHNEDIDLIVIDLVMPAMSGAELCRRIKADRRTQLIPILMLTNVSGTEHEIQGIAAGADEFLTKPLHPEVVRTRIRALLQHKAAIDSLEEAEAILFALAQAVEARDSYTSGHCQRLAKYSVALGQALGLGQDELLALHRGGYLHDIGKISVPDAILFKKGPLTADEWEVMQAHTIQGEAICKPMKTLAPVLPIIRHHHERWDGTGYPDGLQGESIPLLARILQIADVYDALTTARSYKVALPPEKAFETMEEEARRGWRDIELLALFRDMQVHFKDSEAAGLVDVSPMSKSLDAMRRHLG